VNLKRLRKKLLEERRQYLEQSGMIKETGLAAMSLKEQVQEDSTVDNHPGDMGTEMFEQEKDLGLQTNARRRLREIDQALQRMEEGAYGICAVCGQPIDEARLEAFPSAITCIRCQQDQEARAPRYRRPVEEDLLDPVFGRTWRDVPGDPAYDGEDAWQDVARYGTSETPSDLPGAVRYDDLYNTDEDLYTVVDPTEALVDEEGEPILRDARHPDHSTGTLYDPGDMEGNFRWEPAALNRTVMPERQFRRGRFPRRPMP